MKTAPKRNLWRVGEQHDIGDKKEAVSGERQPQKKPGDSSLSGESTPALALAYPGIPS